MLADLNLQEKELSHIGVKEAVFPFARFEGVDTILGPEMRSTGEVIGLDADFATAFAKSQLGAGSTLPEKGTAFVSVKSGDKARLKGPMKKLQEMGFNIVATSGTQRQLQEDGIECAKINKVLEGRPHIVDAMKNGDIQIVINTTEGTQALQDSRSLRRAALENKIPYYTTMAGAEAVVAAIAAYYGDAIRVKSLQDHQS
jgi:carbamoyl-phosphate synthase large subunit